MDQGRGSQVVRLAKICFCDAASPVAGTSVAAGKAGEVQPEIIVLEDD